MYYLVDLYDNFVVECADEYAVANRFIRYEFIFGRRVVDFSNLNVTGKDIIMYPSKDGFESCLRRYQVFDEYSRSVDIRNWDKKFFDPVKRNRRYLGIYSSGRKSHYHRLRGPSLGLRDLHHPIEYSLEDLEYYPIKSKLSLRGKVRVFPLCWDWYEYKGHSKFVLAYSKSWKKNKVRKQYYRHIGNPNVTYDKRCLEVLELL